MDPLRSTSLVFDESVLKVEFLPLPAQVPDFAFNLNTEAAYVRFANLMNGLIGPMRVEGCDASFDFNNIIIQPGLMMMGPFMVRVPEVLSLSADNGDMLYAKCSVIRCTSDNRPDLVNINPPLAPTSLPGPNQYRSTAEFFVAPAGALPANTETDFYYKIAALNVNGAFSYRLRLSDVRLGAIDFQDLVNDIISKHGTSACEWRVGVGVLNGGLGFKAVLENAFTPRPPTNLRLGTITPDGVPYVQETMQAALALPVSGGVVSPNLNVATEWNWSDVTGVGGVNLFRITNDYAWVQNQLTDYYLYIPQVAKNLKIVSNAATSNGETALNVVNEDGSTVDLTGLSVSSTPAIIHCNADAYDVVAIPITRDGRLATDHSVEQTFRYGESPVLMKRNLVLTVGNRYLIKVRSSYGLAKSEWAALAPFTVLLPNLPDNGRLGAAPMPFGFRLTIAGWEGATQFEILYAESPTIPDFGARIGFHQIVSTRMIDISVPTARVWNIAVRPLQGGQSVGIPKTISVSSGSGGVIGQEVILAQFRVHLRAYTALYGGTVAYNRPITSSFEFSDVRDTFAAVMQDIPTDFIGRRFLDTSDKEFLLSEKRGALAFDMVSIDGVSTPAVATGTPIPNGGILPGRVYRVTGFSSVTYNGVVFTTNQHFVGYTSAPSWTNEQGSGTIISVGVLNGTRGSRNVFRSDYFAQDYRLTRVVVNVGVVVGNPTLVWYQGVTPEQYESFVIPATNGVNPPFKDSNLIIRGSAGIRSLVMDLWDPTIPDQTAPQLSGFTGVVTVYAMPYHSVSEVPQVND